MGETSQEVAGSQGNRQLGRAPMKETFRTEKNTKYYNKIESITERRSVSMRSSLPEQMIAKSLLTFDGE